MQGCRCCLNMLRKKLYFWICNVVFVVFDSKVERKNVWGHSQWPLVIKHTYSWPEGHLCEYQISPFDMNLTHHPVPWIALKHLDLNTFSTSPHFCKFRKPQSTAMKNCYEYSLTDSFTGWCHRLMSKIYFASWHVCEMCKWKPNGKVCVSLHIWHSGSVWKPLLLINDWYWELNRVYVS